MGNINIGTPIMFIVIGLIGGIIVFVLWPIQNNAGDTYLLTYINHCELNGERFTNLYEQDVDQPDNIMVGTEEVAIAKSAADTTCSYAINTVTAGTKLVSEHGELVVSVSTQALTVIASSVWTTPTDLQNQYNGLSKLLISVSPIIQVAGFFIFASINAFMMRGSGATGIGGLGQVVMVPVLSLIIMIVQLIVAPFFMGFASDAYVWVSSGRLEILQMFGPIVKLVFGFFPVIFNASLLGGIGYQALQFRNRRRGGSMAM